MPSRKLNVLAQPEPAYEPSAAPRHWPQLVFAREDSAGSDKQAELPARILIVEDDFLVANEIETALSDAGFDVARVAASADEAVELAESQKPASESAVRAAWGGTRRNSRCRGDFPDARDSLHLCYGIL